MTITFAWCTLLQSYIYSIVEQKALLSMRIIDQIRKHLQDPDLASQFQPGAKLPTYSQLAEIFSCSYATVHKAMAQLQREGIVNIENGKGSYIAGSDDLLVDFFLVDHDLPFYRWDKLLQKYLSSHALNIRYRLHSIRELRQPGRMAEILRDCQAVISTPSPGSVDPRFHQNNFLLFPDYAEVLSCFDSPSFMSVSGFFPFSMFTYQMGVNTALLHKTGFQVEDLCGGFDWYPTFSDTCCKKGISPHSMQWDISEYWGFSACSHIIALLKANAGWDTSQVPVQAPFFNSQAGRLFLKIMRDCQLDEEHSFFCNGSVLQFNLGSWISVQNQNRDYAKINVSPLKVLPYRDQKQRQLCTCNIEYLDSYQNPRLNMNQKKRFWKLIKILLSRDFQLDYCNAAGALSLRKDIRPQDYQWNRNGEFNAFIPEKNARYLYLSEMFPPPCSAALAVLLENYLFHHADGDEVLLRMDEKLYRSNALLEYEDADFGQKKDCLRK